MYDDIQSYCLAQSDTLMPVSPKDACPSGCVSSKTYQGKETCSCPCSSITNYFRKINGYMTTVDKCVDGVGKCILNTLKNNKVALKTYYHTLLTQVRDCPSNSGYFGRFAQTPYYQKLQCFPKKGGKPTDTCAWGNVRYDASPWWNFPHQLNSALKGKDACK